MSALRHGLEGGSRPPYANNAGLCDGSAQECFDDGRAALRQGCAFRLEQSADKERVGRQLHRAYVARIIQRAFLQRAADQRGTEFRVKTVAAVVASCTASSP